VADVACDLVVVSPVSSPTWSGRAGRRRTRPHRAIRADDHMETNLHSVFAAGDCAEVMHLVTGRPTWIPLEPPPTRPEGCGRQRRRKPRALRGRGGHIDCRHFRMGFATTGLSVEQARAEGFSAVAARIEAPVRPRYFPGAQTMVELVADRATRRLMGGSVIGEEGAAGRIDVIAAALQSRLRVDEFEQTGPGLLAALRARLGPPADRRPATPQGDVGALPISSRWAGPAPTTALKGIDRSNVASLPPCRTARPSR